MVESRGFEPLTFSLRTSIKSANSPIKRNIAKKCALFCAQNLGSRAAELVCPLVSKIACGITISI